MQPESDALFLARVRALVECDRAMLAHERRGLAFGDAGRLLDLAADRDRLAARVTELEAGEAWTPAARDVLAERARQSTGEGYSPARDDAHVDGELVLAAALYAIPCDMPGMEQDAFIGLDVILSLAYDWNPKPEPDKRRRYVKAAALLLAEIERLDRAALASGHKTPKPGGGEPGTAGTEHDHQSNCGRARGLAREGDEHRPIRREPTSRDDANCRAAHEAGLLRPLQPQAAGRGTAEPAHPRLTGAGRAAPPALAPQPTPATEPMQPAGDEGEG